jgi:Fur family transcriptional regulator, ferric uptake regulator
VKNDPPSHDSSALGRSEPATRRTEQKEAIRRTLEAAARPLSAPEILDAAQTLVPGLGIATVYRNLKQLVDEQWLRPVDLPGEPSRYERAGHDHHHHFQCDACGRVFDVPGCARGIENNAPDGFVVVRHEVLLYGTCAECAAA